MPGALSLKDFLWRAEVKKLYREFLKAIRAAPSHARGQLRGEIRREFDAPKSVDDPHTQKYLLSDGRAKLKQLSEMLGMQL